MPYLLGVEEEWRRVMAPGIVPCDEKNLAG